jgi:hypothetical protein
VEKQIFEVTEKAGAFVAGKRSPGAGKTMSLTAEQAYFALQADELRMPAAQAATEAPAADPAVAVEPTSEAVDAPAEAKSRSSRKG